MARHCVGLAQTSALAFGGQLADLSLEGGPASQPRGRARTGRRLCRRTCAPACGLQRRRLQLCGSSWRLRGSRLLKAPWCGHCTAWLGKRCFGIEAPASCGDAGVSSSGTLRSISSSFKCCFGLCSVTKSCHVPGKCILATSCLCAAVAQDKDQVEEIVEEVVRKRIDGGDLRRLSPFQGVILSKARPWCLRLPCSPSYQKHRLGCHCS